MIKKGVHTMDKNNLINHLMSQIETQSPIIAFCKPSIMLLTDQECQLKIPLDNNTKSHVGSVGFGALAVGADCTGGVLAWYIISKLNQKVDFCFTVANIIFVKKATSDVIFSCKDGDAIATAIAQASIGKEKINVPIQVIAEIITKDGLQTAATFAMNLSLRLFKA